MDRWCLEGYSVMSVLRELYDVNRARIELPEEIDQIARYDFAVVLPQNESKEQIYERLRQGFQEYFAEMNVVRKAR